MSLTTTTDDIGGPPKTQETLPAYMQGSPRKPIMVGLFLVFGLFGGFITWASLAPLESAAIAPGSVQVFSRRQIVSHPEGGVVHEILVRDGDRVEAGQRLLLLDSTRQQAQYSMYHNQLLIAEAQLERLRAERDGKASVEFPPDLLQAAASQPEIAEVLAVQRSLMQTRQEALEGQINVLDQQILQLQQEIAGLEAQQVSRRRQLELIAEELKGTRELYEKGLARKPQMLALERGLASIQGEIGSLESNIARAQQKIGENELQVINLRNQHRNRVFDEIDQLQTQISNLTEQMVSLRYQLQKTEVRAPMAGVVHDTMANTVGGVVGAGQEIMKIVPIEDRMVIEAKVRPQDIDDVHAGLSAEIRFPAFKFRETPLITGNVVSVAPDSLLDPVTRTEYYPARVELDPDTAGLLGDGRLVPGMEAQVMIQLGQRTLMDYILSPVTGGMSTAFREP